jgi:hypothetical protein
MELSYETTDDGMSEMGSLAGVGAGTGTGVRVRGARVEAYGTGAYWGGYTRLDGARRVRSNELANGRGLNPTVRQVV